MQAYLVTIVCKFGGDRAICLREEAICANVYRQTDRRTDDGCLAIGLAHSWNELKKTSEMRTAVSEEKRVKINVSCLDSLVGLV